jgi:hypothetical protein
MPQTTKLLEVRPGAPAGSGALAVVPLFAETAPAAGYVPLPRGRELGLRVEALPAARGVARQVVTNPADTDVLVHQDELLPGSAERCILVGAGSLVLLSRPQRHTRSLADPWSGAGWAADIGFGRHVGSPWRPDPLRAAAMPPPRAGQVGAMILVAGRPVRLDVMSRPEAFAHRYGTLLAAQAAWAARAVPRAADPAGAASALLERVMVASADARDGIGAARHLRVHGPGVVGHGLAVDGEVIQLSVLARRRPPAGV